MMNVVNVRRPSGAGLFLSCPTGGPFACGSLHPRLISGAPAGALRAGSG
jgi:hypothetical protein